MFVLNKNPSRCLVHDVDEAFFDRRFGRRPAGALGSGTFAQQEGNAVLGQFLEAGHVGLFVVQRVGVEAEIAAVDDAPGRRIDNYRRTARDGVRDTYQFNEEIAQFQAFVIGFVHDDGFKLETVGHRDAEVRKNFLDSSDGEAAAVNGDVVFGQDVRQAADVI
jgi:hypothetical protein